MCGYFFCFLGWGGRVFPSEMRSGEEGGVFFWFGKGGRGVVFPSRSVPLVGRDDATTRGE